MNSGRGGTTVNAGTIDASGEVKGTTGGRVEVLGDKVEMTAGSLVDVSGDTGGGVALIGGDYQGKNPEISSAKTTKVAAGALIIADAKSRGDGGTAIVWADDSTEFAGTITARGGAAGGNGGFAEVSGKEALSFTGMVDLSTQDGKFGTLLLDPKNTRVANGGTATPGDVGSFGTNPGTDAIIAPGTLRDLLANIVIQTNNDFRLETALDLTTTTGGDPTAGKSFTVQAGRTIQIEGALTTSNGAVNMTANATTAAGVNAAHRDAGTASIVFQPTGSLTTNGGDVNLTIDTGAGLNDPSSQDISFAFSTINAGSGDVTLINRGPGNGGIYGYIAGKVLGNELTMEAVGNIWFFNDQNDVNTLYVTNGGSVDFTNATDLVVGKATPMGGGLFSYTGSLQVGRGDVKITTKAGDLTLNAPAFQLNTNNTPTGVFSLDAAGKLLVNEGVNKLLGQIGVDVTYKGGTDVELKPAEIGARNLTVQATNDILLNLRPVVGKYGIVAQDANPHGTVTFTAGRDILGSAASTISGRDLQMTATIGRIDLDGIVNVNLLSATAAGNVDVDGTFANSIDALGAISSGANITINDHSLGLQINDPVRSTGVNGNITIKATGGGTVQFLPGSGARIETLPAGTIHFESTGQILDGTTPSFVGGSLALTGRALGGGTTNPLNTQVSRLEASAKASGGFGGFAFITNNEAATGTLAIGGVSASLGGVTADGRNSNNVSIRLVNNGSVILDPAVGTDLIGAANPNNPLGDVTVMANGAASDISVGSGFFGVGIISDSKLTLNAGNNILIGEGANASIRGGTGVELTAGGSLHVKNDASIIVLGSGLLQATANNSIQSLPTTLDSTAFRSAGGITLVAQHGLISLGSNNGTNPVLRANQYGGSENVVLQANTMVIGGKIAAGNGDVELQQFDSAVSVVIGTKTANELSFTDAELDLISAARLHIGSFMALPTTFLTVDAPISRPTTGATYGPLQLMSPGQVNIQSSLDMGLGNLAIASLGGNIQGGGNVTAHDLSLFSSTGSINLNGDLNVVNLELNAPGGNVSVGGNNSIQNLTSARFDRELIVRDTVGGLVINGIVDGGAISKGLIHVPNGPITLAAGAKVYFGGNASQEFRFVGTGFSNQSGDANVLVPENGGRWLIYSSSPQATTLNGLVENFRIGNVNFPDAPANPGNGLLFSSANPTVTPPPPPPPPSSPPVSDFIPAPQRLFRLVSIEETIVEQLLRRFGDLPDGNMKDLLAGNPESLEEMISAMEELIRFIEYELEAAADTAQKEGLANAKTTNDRLDALTIGLLFKSVLSSVPKMNQALTEFSTGKITMAAVTAHARSILEDIDKIGESFDSRAKFMAELARKESERARALARAEANALYEAKLSTLDRVLQPGGLTEQYEFALTQGIQTVFNGRANFNPLSMTPQQLGQLDRGQVLRMLAMKGVQLSPTDMIAARTASFTPDQFTRMVAAGGGNLTAGQFSAMVAAGAGNLTVNQMVAAGGMNMVAAGGMNFSIVDRAGNVLSHNGGTLKFSEFARLIGMDGGTLIGQDGSTLIGMDGGTLIGMDGGTLIGMDGGTLIGMDGGTFVATLASLIGNDGGTLLNSATASILSHNGGQILSPNGGLILSPNGGQLIQGIQAGSNAINIGAGIGIGTGTNIQMQINPRQ